MLHLRVLDRQDTLDLLAPLLGHDPRSRDVTYKWIKFRALFYSLPDNRPIFISA